MRNVFYLKYSNTQFTAELEWNIKFVNNCHLLCSYSDITLSINNLTVILLI